MQLTLKSGRTHGLRVRPLAVWLPGLLLIASGAKPVGAAPQYHASPSPMDFGSVKLGQSLSKTLTIENTGDGTFSVNSVKVLLAQVELPGQTDSHPEDNILTQPVTVGP